MRKIRYTKVVSIVSMLCQTANIFLPPDVFSALRNARTKEVSPFGQAVLDQILRNNEIATDDDFPICQDCGAAVVFLEIGDEARVVGGNLFEAVQEGVRQGYKDGYLRKSICHPLTRKNTGDNTPAVIHLEIVKGDRLKITVCPKGGGSENMSRIKMLNPSDGAKGVKEFVINAVREAGSNPCPPIVVGVGIGGGSFEKTAFLAKKALLRKIGSANQDSELDVLEKELLSEINKLGIGPAGLGGEITALAVHIEILPCHIASLPVAVNLNCHAARHWEAVL